MGSKLLNPRQPEFWLIGAVFLTVVGDIALQLLTGEFLDWERREWITKPILLAAAIALTLGFGPKVASFLRGRRGQANVEQLNDIDSAPALIVFVSANPTGGFTTAISTFAEASDSLLRHLFLIHSTQASSTTNARERYDAVNDGNHPYTAYLDGLQADFNDMSQVKAVTRRAVRNALECEGIEGKDIVIDITGGNAIASAGAVLAALEVEDVTVTYIPQGAANRPGKAVKRIDIKFAREP